MKSFCNSFRVPIYESRVFVACARSAYHLADIAPPKLTKYDPEPLEQAEAAAIDYHNGHMLLAFFRVPTHNMVAHECYHVTVAILKRAEVRRDEEAFAYLTGALHERVYRILRKHKIKVRN